MQLKFILVADAANVSREGKLNIAGEFNTMFGTTLPLVWPFMVIVVRLEAHPGEGPDHAAQFRVTDQDGHPILESPPMPINFHGGGSGIPARADLRLALAGVAFPQFGDYTVHLLVDGVQRGDTTMYVRRRTDVPQLPHRGG